MANFMTRRHICPLIFMLVNIEPYEKSFGGVQSIATLN